MSESFVETNESKLAWYLTELAQYRKAIKSNICKMVFLQSFLILVAFSLPILVPFTTGQTESFICMAVAEIGLIISVFMACKYSYGAIISFFYCLALIVSYATIYCV